MEEAEEWELGVLGFVAGVTSCRKIELDEQTLRGITIQGTLDAVFGRAHNGSRFFKLEEYLKEIL